MKKIYYLLFILGNLIIFGLLARQLYKIQVVKALDFKNNQSIKKITPLRGEIYVVDKEGKKYPVALSLYTYDLYFYPPKSKNISDELKKINQILNLPDIDKIEKRLINSKQSVILAKNISQETKEKLEKLRFDSIFFEEKVKRVYPQKNLLSTVLGFVRFNSESNLLEGQYGLEKYYDEVLKGEIGYRTNSKIIKSPKKGAEIVLNIDYYVQQKIEEILKSKVEEYKAEGGLIIVIEAKTGNIKGLAELPNYNPEEYYKVEDYSVFISKISRRYEPGSVMKPFFYAGAFEENLLNPEDKYEDKGYVILNGWKIENFDKKARGVVDLKTALEQSLNTGSIYVSQVLGKTRFIKYVEKFRLNKKAEIDFPILEEPNFKNLKDPGKEVNFGTASFGQGVTVSPLNLIQSYLAFANKGKIMKLNFVKEINYFDGHKKEIYPQVIKEKVLSQKTLEKMIPILEGVVENQAKKARIKGYSIAGKTGSANIPLVKIVPDSPKGYSDEVITTFIGFLPARDPEYIVLVRLDRPAKNLLAFGTAAPTFKLVAEFLINYYNIPPDKFSEIINLNY